MWEEKIKSSKETQTHGFSIGESLGATGLGLGRNFSGDEKAEEGYKRRFWCVSREASVTSSSSASSSQSSSSPHRSHFRCFRRVSLTLSFTKFCLFPQKNVWRSKNKKICFVFFMLLFRFLWYSIEWATIYSFFYLIVFSCLIESWFLWFWQ